MASPTLSCCVESSRHHCSPIDRLIAKSSSALLLAGSVNLKAARLWMVGAGHQRGDFADRSFGDKAGLLGQFL